MCYDAKVAWEITDTSPVILTSVRTLTTHREEERHAHARKAALTIIATSRPPRTKKGKGAVASNIPLVENFACNSHNQEENAENEVADLDRPILQDEGTSSCRRASSSRLDKFYDKIKDLIFCICTKIDVVVAEEKREKQTSG